MRLWVVEPTLILDILDQVMSINPTKVQELMQIFPGIGSWIFCPWQLIQLQEYNKVRP
jgi:hypothetical protein